MQNDGNDDMQEKTNQQSLSNPSAGVIGCIPGFDRLFVPGQSPAIMNLDTRFLNGGVQEAMANAAHQTPRYFGSRTKLLVGRREFDDVRQSIENEMAALSIQERKRVHEDLHGYPCSINETEEVVHRSLAELETCLNEIPEKDAYDIAMSMSPEFVKDRSFRLLFLRTMEFDAKRAAVRMVNHFKQKQFLFGKEKLVQQITLDDLDEAAIKCLKSGSLIFLPEKDTSGRLIIILLCSRLTYDRPKSFCRMQWYLDMKHMREDEENQRNGHVVILFMYGAKFNLGSLDAETWKLATLTSEAMPMRMVALHYCSDGPRFSLAFKAVMEMVSIRRRVRVRTHLVSPLESLYILETFGIPRRILPVDETGQVDLARYNERLSIELSQRAPANQTNQTTRLPQNPEKSISTVNYVAPQAPDVLMGGRGNHKHENGGNAQLRDLVQSLQSRYNDSSKFDKTVLAQMIVRSIKDRGGRFLKKIEDRWIEVSDELAREKVAHSFRNNRRAKKNR